MKVYIIIGSNEDESHFIVSECYLSEESAYEACSRLIFANEGIDYYVISREIVDYDRKK